MRQTKIFITLLLTLSICVFSSCSSSDDSNDISSCANAIENTATATTNFGNATEANFTELCNAYKEALQSQITVCGDADGILQSIIDGLGDCSVSTSNVLCDGIGSTSLFPLAIGNQWKYSTNGNLFIQLDVNEVVTVAGQDYFLVESSGPGSFSDIRFRTASNGDVYRVTDAGVSPIVEKLYLPNNPTVGQQWDDFASCIGTCTGYRIVDSVNFTLQTPECTYTDCVVVKNYTVQNGQTTFNYLRIYKRGIGLVGGLSSSKLTSLTLN